MLFKSKICNLASQLGVGHKLSMPTQGDLVADGKWMFEVGGKSKGFSQIKGIDNSYVVSDDIDIGHGKKIPLWLLAYCTKEVRTNHLIIDIRKMKTESRGLRFYSRE